MVMINCREMKLVDMTVTCQRSHPNRPIMAIAETMQHSIGKQIQRTPWKMMPNVRASATTPPTPNTFRSLLMKVIMSSAIMLVPPRNKWALREYRFMTDRMEAISSWRRFVISSPRCRSSWTTRFSSARSD